MESADKDTKAFKTTDPIIKKLGTCLLICETAIAVDVQITPLQTANLKRLVVSSVERQDTSLQQKKDGIWRLK